MEPEQFFLQLHIVVLGQPGCGKTTFVEKLKQGFFIRDDKVYFGTQPYSKFEHTAVSSSGQTIKAVCHTYEANVVQDKPYGVLDMSKFPPSNKISALFLLFDMTKRKAIRNVHKQYRQFQKKIAQQQKNTIREYPCLMIGTRALGLPRRVTIQQLQKANLPFIETDAQHDLHCFTALQVAIAIQFNKKIYKEWLNGSKDRKRPVRQTVRLVFQSYFRKPSYPGYDSLAKISVQCHMDHNFLIRSMTLPDEPQLYKLGPPPFHQETQIPNDYIIQ